MLIENNFMTDLLPLVTQPTHNFNNRILLLLFHQQRLLPLLLIHMSH